MIFKIESKAAFPQKTFDDEGFPSDICKAFQATANTTKLLIMSRVPGGNCNQLIAESYDQKGFFIKAKSCNWGPMSGFICQLPPFNKKGASNEKGKLQMNKNQKEVNKYYIIYNNFHKMMKANEGKPLKNRFQSTLTYSLEKWS